jgi:ABC-2 type transport system permease protein
MTTTSAPTPTTDVARASLVRHRHVVTDAITMAWRSLTNVRRTPQLLIFATIQPVTFVVMFAYVFGGAISTDSVGGIPYIDYMMPGIFVQTVVFSALATGVGLAEDLHKGLIDRFRSLPMARSAVLVGRTLADVVRNTFVMFLMCIVGYLIGWRIHTNAVSFLFAIALMIAFSYSLSWVFAIVGLSVRDAETAQAASFPIMAPLVFASSAFIPVDTMPGWLQVWAEHQPVSAVVDAARALTVGGPTTEAVIKAIAWIVALVLVCAPIAIRRYRRIV